MKHTAFRLAAALVLCAGVSCQSSDSPPPADDAPRPPSKPAPSLSEFRVPNRSRHQILPGVSISAERVTGGIDKKRFSGRVLVENTIRQSGDFTAPGIPDHILVRIRYATASEAVWIPSTQTLELHGHPAIEYTLDGFFQVGGKNTVVTLLPSGIRSSGPGLNRLYYTKES